VRKWTMTQRLSRNSKIASAGTTATRQSAKKNSVKRLGNLLRTLLHTKILRHSGTKTSSEATHMTGGTIFGLAFSRSSVRSFKW
jgi:hypothetical protein